MKSFKFERIDSELPYITNYSFNSFKFAFLSKLEDGIIKQCAKISDCRETLNHYIRRFIYCITRKTKKEINEAFNEKNASGMIRRNMNLSKLRLLVYNKANNNHKITLQQLKNGVKVINILEERNNWPLTKIYDLKEKNQLKNIFYKMLIGSKKWIRSPHIFSLFVLILKTSQTDLFENVKTYEDIISQCEKIKHSSYRDRSKTIFGNVRTTYKVWDLMLEKYNNLFRDLSMCDNYICSKATMSLDYHEGIHKLCTNLSFKKVINKRFNSLCEKENIILGD